MMNGKLHLLQEDPIKVMDGLVDHLLILIGLHFLHQVQQIKVGYKQLFLVVHLIIHTLTVKM